MLTYEEAYKVAESLMSEINRCVEDNLSYIFYYDCGVMCYGGYGSPCVVLKADGKAVSMPNYIIRFGGGKAKSIRKMIVGENGKIEGELPLDEKDEEDEDYEDYEFDDDDADFYDEDE